ncbi:MAG: alpha-amylase, partial [Paludibacteraceae bacterium]|nr:alpha-amylase [Paludibacteraceae bacterium]
MKKLFLILLCACALASCTKPSPRPHASWSYDATIYELNTRQFTPEGTFAAAEAELPALKELGVDIIWMMPLQPIGVITRKGTLGSYYSIIDYCDFNPEFGTREDFEHFLAKA